MLATDASASRLSTGAAEELAETPAAAVEPAIRLPHVPTPPEPQPFPTIAMLAPMALGLTLYMVIGSPQLLLLMLFGPLLMLAQLLDRRIGGRRRLRRQREQFLLELQAAERLIVAAHERMRVRARALHPLARDLVRGGHPVIAEDEIVVGTTKLPSTLRIEGGDHGDTELERVHRLAQQVADMPVVVADGVITLAGTERAVVSAACALIVQRSHRRPSESIALAGTLLGGLAAQLESWGVSVDWRRDYQPGTRDRVIVADETAAPEGRTIVLGARGEGVLREVDGSRIAIHVDTIGLLELRNWLQQVVVPAQQRAREQVTAIPDSCPLLPMLSGSGDRVSATDLVATFAVTAQGPLRLDLVANGPHAVIAGTTGSGKSELLVAWASALADRYAADACQFLCLDFKGGATFDALRQLPHCVGVITDLDEGEARRVLVSLQAELRRREQRLRELGVRDIIDTRGDLPRLVVFVDEYQALVSEHSDLAEVFADIGSRGRSLGIHLVLCTQRPTGVFREALLANCALRLCLRVEQAVDSRTLLGVEDAAGLPVSPRGRLLCRIGNGDLEIAQVARASAEDIAAIAARERERRREAKLPPIGRPWHASLPTDTPQSGASWATIDEPELQRQWQAPAPAPGQHTWVVGGPRSGKSTALASLALAAQASGRTARWIGSDVEVAFEVLGQLLAAPAGDEVILIDDLDAIEQQLPEPHRGEFLDLLLRLVRMPSSRSIVISTTRMSGSLQSLSSFMSSVLRLVTHSKQEWLLAGGESGHYLPRFIPGRGRLNGLLAQVSNCDASAVLQAAAPVMHDREFVLPKTGCAVVTRNPQRIAQWCEAAGFVVNPVPKPTAVPAPAASTLQVQHGHAQEPAQVLIGDPEQWQGSYGVLARVAQRLPVLIAGIEPAQWRALLREDVLPPPILDTRSTGLWRSTDGTFTRIRLRDGVPWQLRMPAWR